jgi:hypothetical protein
VLVQVKNKSERSLPVRPPSVEKTSRLGSRDPVASEVKYGPHGGKNGKYSFMNSSSPERISRNPCKQKGSLSIRAAQLFMHPGLLCQ